MQQLTWVSVHVGIASQHRGICARCGGEDHLPYIVGTSRGSAAFYRRSPMWGVERCDPRVAGAAARSARLLRDCCAIAARLLRDLRLSGSPLTNCSPTCAICAIIARLLLDLLD